MLRFTFFFFREKGFRPQHSRSNSRDPVSRTSSLSSPGFASSRLTFFESLVFDARLGIDFAESNIFSTEYHVS